MLFFMIHVFLWFAFTLEVTAHALNPVSRHRHSLLRITLTASDDPV
jgi:hypothetical protein